MNRSNKVLFFWVWMQNTCWSIFISVKSRDTRWPFHGSQFTPWQQHSRLSEKEIEEGKRRVWLEGGDGVRRGEMRETREGWESHRRGRRQWPTGRLVNTNKHQPLASFHVSINLFWLLLHFVWQTLGETSAAAILGTKTRRELRNPLAFSSVSDRSTK